MKKFLVCAGAVGVFAAWRAVARASAPAAIGTGVLMLILGVGFGVAYARMRRAHADYRATKATLPGLRRGRRLHFARALLWGALAIIALYAGLTAGKDG